VKNSLQDMKDFADGKIASPWDAQAARPFPNRFDFRSARVRAFILWELREYPRRRGYDGKDINPVELLARSHTTAYQHVVRGTPSVSHPANRLIFPTKPGISVRSALLSLPPGEEKAVLASQGIPLPAMVYLRAGDGEGFVAARADAMISRERSFMIEMGIVPAAEPDGETDIDTE
jgi:hypothetical protein